MKANDPSSPREAPGRRAWLVPALTFSVAAVPVMYLVSIVLRYSVPIPLLDDWEMVPLITKAREGALTFAALFEQQQEARTFFPKLIFILCALKHWDSRIAMMLSILICCGTSIGLYLLMARTGLSRLARAAAFLLMVFLIFSPVQHELWLLASGFPSFVPALCVVWGIFITQTRLSTATKFWLCLALAWFSSFTLSHGLLAWGLTFPVLFLTRPPPNWKRWAGFWVLAGAMCVTIYFWDFQARPDLPGFAPRRSLVDYGQYVTAFLGSGLARAGNENPLAMSTLVGVVLLLAYLAAAGRAAFRFRDREYAVRVVPWIALGAYSLCSGCLAALGRIAWGVSQALESRYVPFSLYLTVALIALATIFITEFSKTPRGARARPAILGGTVFLAGIYLVLVMLCAVASLPAFQMRSAVTRLGHGAVLFSQVVDVAETIKKANFPRPAFVIQNANALDRFHLLRTPLIRSREISKLRHANADDITASGFWETLTPAENGGLTARGWAALKGRGRPADCVVLAYGDERGEWIVFALSNVVAPRTDVVNALKNPEQLWSEWRVTFRRDAVPKGAKISAWAVDAKGAKLYRLKELGNVSNL